MAVLVAPVSIAHPRRNLPLAVPVVASLVSLAVVVCRWPWHPGCVPHLRRASSNRPAHSGAATMSDREPTLVDPFADSATAGTAAPGGQAAVSGAMAATDGGAAPALLNEPAESGRRADSLLTPDVTGGSEGFAPTPGGTLLAPDVAPDETDPSIRTDR